MSRWIPASAAGLLPLILLGVALVVGLIYGLNVWKSVKEVAPEKTDTPEDLFQSLSDAYAAGQMSEEEYHKIRASLGIRGEAPGSRAIRARQDRSSDSDSG